MYRDIGNLVKQIQKELKSVGQPFLKAAQALSWVNCVVDRLLMECTPSDIIVD